MGQGEKIIKIATFHEEKRPTCPTVGHKFSSGSTVFCYVDFF